MRCSPGTDAAGGLQPDYTARVSPADRYRATPIANGDT